VASFCSGQLEAITRTGHPVSLGGGARELHGSVEVQRASCSRITPVPSLQVCRLTAARSTNDCDADFAGCERQLGQDAFFFQGPWVQAQGEAVNDESCRFLYRHRVVWETPKQVAARDCLPHSRIVCCKLSSLDHSCRGMQFSP